MTAVPASVVGQVPAQWYRDPISCLQATLATLLIRAGEDPLETLGLGWEFRYLPGDVRFEEFYWPCRYPGDVVRSVLPWHAATSRWRTAPQHDPLSAVEECLADGRLPIVAVDNYHLPFRPAYHDVHAAHLLVVYEVDRSAAEVGVSDTMPPAFAGRLPVADLLRSWRSANPLDDQDVFFSGSGIGKRWLDVRFDTPFGALDPAGLRTALRGNLRGFAEPVGAPPGARVGLRGVSVLVDEIVDRAGAGDGRALAEVYTFGWSMQAQAALHGELLRRCGDRWGIPLLAETGRRVERVAHRWTAVRVSAAHGRTAPTRWVAPLRRHGTTLRRAYEETVESVRLAVEAL